MSDRPAYSKADLDFAAALARVVSRYASDRGQAKYWRDCARWAAKQAARG